MGIGSGGIDLGSLVSTGNLESKLSGAADHIEKFISTSEKLANLNISPKIKIQVDAKDLSSINNIEKSVKTVRSNIEKMLNKPLKTKSLLPTDQLVGNDKRQLNKLVNYASDQGASGKELKNAENTYSKMMKLMVSIRKTKNDIKDGKGIFSSTEDFSRENILERAKAIQQMQNSQNKLIELNKSLPSNLQITDDVYKKFGEYTNVDKIKSSFDQLKQSLIDTTMEGTGFVSFLEQAAKSGKEITDADLTGFVDKLGVVQKNAGKQGNSSGSSTSAAQKEQESLADATQKANDNLKQQQDLTSGNKSSGGSPVDPTLIERMKQAYQDLCNEQEKYFNLSKSGFTGTTVLESSKAKVESLKQSYTDLAQQVTDAFGKDVQKSSIADIGSKFNSNISQSFTKDLKSYESSIDSLQKKLSGSEFSNALKEQLGTLKTDLQDVRQEFTQMAESAQKSGTAMDTSKLIEGSTKIKGQIDSIKQLSNFDSQIGKLDKISVLEGKIPAFSSKVQELKASLQNLFDGFQNTGKLDVNKVKELQASIEQLTQTRQNYAKVTKQGKLDADSFGNIKDIKDAEAVVKKYGEALDNAKLKNVEFSSDMSKVTATYQKSNKELVKLTGTLDKQTNSVRIKETNAGYGNLLGGMGAELGKVTSQFAAYFTGYRAVTRVISEMREGLNVFKEYDAALTNISYTMDINKQGLDEMGKSAVNMAKDLSMSLSDSLDIYQIYANMNTSAQEIAETAKPTAILSNLSGVDASTASDQVQGILQQFNLLKDGSADVAETSMHVVDVLDKISANVAMDYSKGIGVITDAVTAAGAVANDAGLSFEQLAAISAKVAERTREDGSSIGNAIKTIATRVSKVGKMPGYADEVSNEELSKASESLHEIGVEVYNTDGSYRELGTILTELQGKWDGLTDAQQANISYNVAATRLTFSLCMKKFILGMILIAGNASIGQSYLLFYRKSLTPQ